MRLGLIARMDKTGLANQTRNLAELLQPSKVLVIDSLPFGKGRQYPDMYRGYNAYGARGMLRSSEGIRFIRGVDALLSCEMFYSPTLINDCRRVGVKTFLQYNYEFLINLSPGNHPWPDYLLAPSKWHFEEMDALVGQTNQQTGQNIQHIYLPPPTNENSFTKAREVNLAKTGKRKFLHIVGNIAAHDRNGTDDVIQALGYTNADFELHIKSQTQLPYTDLDPRIMVDYTSPLNESELYEGYDALIMPRRYAGLCLPMNEALMSALPVIMPDIDPNNKILPPEWLVEARKRGEFMTKTLVDIYESDLQKLADKLEWLCSTEISVEKEKAYKLGFDNFSYEVLGPKYMQLLEA
jgi:hypothetical protein